MLCGGIYDDNFEYGIALLKKWLISIALSDVIILQAMETLIYEYHSNYILVHAKLNFD